MKVIGRQRVRIESDRVDPRVEGSGEAAGRGGQRQSSEVAEESRVEPPAATRTPELLPLVSTLAEDSIARRVEQCHLAAGRE